MRSGIGAFCGLVTLAFVLGLLFVWWQRELIANLWVLVGVSLLLLLLSFWTSATEAAYAVVSTLGAHPKLAADLQQEAARLSEAFKEEKLLENPDLLDTRKLKRLVAIQSSLQAGSRDSYVGAFASASVFLNTALVAFLPVALVTHPLPKTTLQSLLGTLVVYGFPANWEAHVTGTKWLTFVVTTFSLLVLGKLVPKMVGFAYPYLFTYTLAAPARVVHFFFGWIGRGARFPFGRLLPAGSQRDRKQAGG